jgi:hypothetical protein
MEDWRELVKLGRFAEAEPLMLAAAGFEREEDPYSDNTVTRAEFYEAWGDATRDPVAATDHYNQADYYFSIFAHGRPAAARALQGCRMLIGSGTKSQT